MIVKNWISNRYSSKWELIYHATISDCDESLGINIVFISADSGENIWQYKEIKEIESL